MAGELPFEKPLNDLRQKITELKSLSVEKGIDFSEEILGLESKCKQLEEEMYSELTPAQKNAYGAPSSASDIA
jgi:acetyl-CoA carboxylase carboxyl transferase subunit alpha